MCMGDPFSVPFIFSWQYMKQENTVEQFSSLSSWCISSFAVEPPYYEPLYNEVLGITNNFLYPSNYQTYKKEHRYDDTLL